MSWLKFSFVLSTGLSLFGLTSRMALSAEAPPPSTRDSAWDGGPLGGPSPSRQPPAQGDERRARPPRVDDSGPPGPPEARGGQPPFGPAGIGTFGGMPPGGPAGQQPPGPPPAFPPRGPNDFEAMRTNDPELYKAMQEDFNLERQSRDLADQYRRAGKADQAKIKEKLVEIVNKHFEVRQQLRNLEVKTNRGAVEAASRQSRSADKEPQGHRRQAHHRIDRRGPGRPLLVRGQSAATIVDRLPLPRSLALQVAVQIGPANANAIADSGVGDATASNQPPHRVRTDAEVVPAWGTLRQLAGKRFPWS